jgi:hypothetical protein
MKLAVRTEPANAAALVGHRAHPVALLTGPERKVRPWPVGVRVARTRMKM